MLTVTEVARKKVIDIMDAEGKSGCGLRIMAQSGGCSGIRYGLSFVEEGGRQDDVTFEVEGFKVHMDPASAGVLEGGTLDFLETPSGSGFKIDAPMARPAVTPPAKPTGPQAEAVQRLLEEVINPGIASHGGFVTLMDVKDDVVYVQLGGGCQGCGMVDVTLKQGIEAIIKERMPEIQAVYDVTDHAGGKNPYYQPRRF